MSRLTVWVAVAVLPALSVAVPRTAWPAPSSEMTREGVQEAMPEPVSSHVKETVTLLLFQPLVAAGDWEARMLGAVLSTLTVTVFAASVLPARSTLQ